MKRKLTAVILCAVLFTVLMISGSAAAASWIWIDENVSVALDSNFVPYESSDDFGIYYWNETDQTAFACASYDGISASDLEPVLESSGYDFVKVSDDLYYGEQTGDDGVVMDIMVFTKNGVTYLMCIIHMGTERSYEIVSETFASVNLSTSGKNGLSLDDDGIWRYYENDAFIEKTGVVDFGGGQFFVANGVLCSDANGLAEFGGQWYFLAGGQVQTQYTGLAEYTGHWFYVTNGLFDPNLNGVVDYDGSKFIVAAGERIYGINGLWQNVDGTWYYFADGQAVTYYTGLTQYDGAWFYVIDGRLAVEFSGTVEYDGASFQVVNGQVVP